MLGPMITQESIDRSPWYAKAIFYTMAFVYLSVGTIAHFINRVVRK